MEDDTCRVREERVDDNAFRHNAKTAYRAVYAMGKGIKSAAVEAVLGAKLYVPTHVSLRLPMLPCRYVSGPYLHSSRTHSQRSYRGSALTFFLARGGTTDPHSTQGGSPLSITSAVFLIMTSCRVSLSIDSNVTMLERTGITPCSGSHDSSIASGYCASDPNPHRTASARVVLV